MTRPYELLEWIFWAALLFVAGWAWCRWFVKKRPYWLLFAVVVGLLSFLTALVGLRVAYVAPLAFIQDVVAARQVMKGEPLPATDITPLVKQVLAAAGRPASLESVWPGLAARFPGAVLEEQQEYDKISALIIVQAHPPLATMFVVPFVYFFGVHGSSLAFSIVSIGCLAATLALLYRGLQLNMSTSQKVLYWSVLLGWYPMFWVLRSGQWGAILSFLVVAGWYGIRRDRQILGGIAVGLAVSLKLYPALLVVYLLLRFRRAFWAAVATIIVTNAATMAVLGPRSFLDYSQTARFVAGNYGHTLANWSLWSGLRLLGEIVSIPAVSSRAAFLALALLLVVAICLLVLAERPSDSQTDVEYSLFVVAMTLLSPTCWSHYFVVLHLPLAVLATRSLRNNAVAGSTFLGLFLVLAAPGALPVAAQPYLENHFGIRAGNALLLLPTMALLGMIVWLAISSRKSFESGDEPKQATNSPQ
jgi:uncharacterized membrane protein